LGSAKLGCFSGKHIRCYNPDLMDIKDLTQHMHRFVREKGWYQPDSLRPQTLKNLAISLNLEASEVLEYFQWAENLDDRAGLSSELADVALYLLQISSLSGIDLEHAIMDKLASNYQRTWDGIKAANQPPTELNDRDEPSVYPEIPLHRMRVTVFGGSKPVSGEAEYAEALTLGRLLGDSGYIVLTGGYIGTMEAVSRGTAEAGGHVIGVTCDEIEAWRPVTPNPWVQEEMRFPTLRERLYALIENCDAALALPGGIGTLAEIAIMWSQLQTGASKSRPLILIGRGWETLIQTFYNFLGEYIPGKDRGWLHFVPDVESAVHVLPTLIFNS
jgi:uncharacterized protein (TIGR00730 family)